ncbi:MAG: bifunctional 5,10-methylenetetrahydrofolate dehydrogenase/5,10-methenyltetrahydrofolate cyclohydrolase [Bdellovibrio sp.]|nr:bifunctional 5,10-methylenetetrahydrofolate dehydrogenase/5,10-methenyltetrahydrofolate cyclohydrolase [Bdellovibrio sp.]
MIELKGKPVADSVFTEITNQLTLFTEKKWAMPHLVVVLVGENPASEVYVSHKEKACQKLNFKSTLVKLPETATESDVRQTLEKLNQDQSVDAVLLQLPLPAHLDSKKLTEVIYPNKDADGLTQASLGALMAGQQKVASCTSAGIIKMLEFYNINVVNKKVVVVGRSLIVGLPLFHLLLQKNATVTLCHSKTENIKQVLQDADVAFVAIGKPNFFKATDFKKGATVIDVGIHRLPEGLCGDVNPESAAGHLSAMTPVPGGVGPMTIAMLMKNTMTLALENRIG